MGLKSKVTSPKIRKSFLHYTKFDFSGMSLTPLRLIMNLNPGKVLSIILLSFISFAGWSQNSEGLREINGIPIYIKIMGKGEPLLIVHGGPGMNHSYFIPHLNKLAEKYQLIYYDQRACGKSGIPPMDSLSLSFFADDIEGIRQAAGVPQLNILAHSWGAIPAIQFAIKYPDKIKSLILCNAVPFNNEFDEEIKNKQLSRMTSQDSTDRSIIRGSLEFKSQKPEAYRKLLLFSFRHSFYDPSNIAKFQFDMPANYLWASQALFAGLSKDLASYNYYPQLRSFTFPVLIMHGADDALPLTSSKKAMEFFRYSSLQIFNKSGHFIFIDEPKKFLKGVNDFLKQ
jgi:proline iminopeptidase